MKRKSHLGNGGACLLVSFFLFLLTLCLPPSPDFQKKDKIDQLWILSAFSAAEAPFKAAENHHLRSSIENADRTVALNVKIVISNRLKLYFVHFSLDLNQIKSCFLQPGLLFASF